MTARDMVLASPRLTAIAGGPAGVDQILAAIEDVWLVHDGARVHLEHHHAERPKATVVFQPGSGAHARLYFVLGGLLARHGYELLAIDRPGHGRSDGVRGHCTVEQALAVTAAALAHARRARRPVVLMGSSLGGLLTVFAVLTGLAPDVAIAHNFVYPGKLLSLRLRAAWIARRRTRPYTLAELVHGFERLSADPAVRSYLRSRADPDVAWELTAESVASLFAFRAPAPARAPETLVLTGGKDTAIPAWATRLFTWWSGLPRYEVVTLPRAGHLLFHDHVDATVPLVTRWLDARLGTLA